MSSTKDDIYLYDWPILWICWYATYSDRPFNNNFLVRHSCTKNAPFSNPGFHCQVPTTIYCNCCMRSNFIYNSSLIACKRYWSMYILCKRKCRIHGETEDNLNTIHAIDFVPDVHFQIHVKSCQRNTVCNLFYLHNRRRYKTHH